MKNATIVLANEIFCQSKCFRIVAESRAPANPLAVLTVKQIAHSLPPCLVGFALGLAFVGVHAALGGHASRLRLTALRAAVRETGLIRLQLELFRAHNTHSNRESHT